jgi:hypothetical protein
VLGGAGQRRRVRVGDLAVGQGLGGAWEGAAVQRAGDPEALVGVGVAHPGPIAQPAGGGLGRGAVVGAGGAAAVDPGQFPQPVAFPPLQQPAQHQHPPGGFGVGERVQVFGGQLVDHRGQPVQAGRRLRRMCVRVHGRNLPDTSLHARPNPTSVDEDPTAPAVSSLL